jgi:hypothetical protein
MSTGVTVYDGGADTPFVDGSDGVITHGNLSPPTITSEDRQALQNAGAVFASHGLDAQRSIKAAEQFYGELLADQARGDEKDRREIRAQMQGEWGQHYGASVKRIKTFIDTLPMSVQDVLWEGRTAANTLALNDPSVLRWLLRLSQPAGAYPSQNVDAERNQILHVMRTDRTRYNRDEAMQQRLRELNAMMG